MGAVSLQSNYEFYVSTDLNQYKDEWVAVCDNVIVAHGKNIKAVAQEAKKVCGIKKFLLARIPSEETMIF